MSSLYTGGISDKQITRCSGILELIEPGDSVMADKGFDISFRDGRTKKYTESVGIITEKMHPTHYFIETLLLENTLYGESCLLSSLLTLVCVSIANFLFYSPFYFRGTQSCIMQVIFGILTHPHSYPLYTHA